MTVNLKGASVGDKVHVDPADPFMAACIKQGILVPTGAPVEEAVESQDELDNQPDQLSVDP